LEFSPITINVFCKPHPHGPSGQTHLNLKEMEKFAGDDGRR